MGHSACDAPSSPQHDLHGPCWSDFDGAELAWVDGQPRVVWPGSVAAWEKAAYAGGGGGGGSGTLFDCFQSDLANWLDEREGAALAEPRVPADMQQLVVLPAVFEGPSSVAVEGGGAEAVASSVHVVDGSAGLAASVLSDGDPVLAAKAEDQPQQAEDANKERRSARKKSLSTKRRRTACVHNQSEKKRRERFNHRMKALQKLLPRPSKNDKVSILDDVISYTQRLQRQMQLQVMSNLPHMMVPMLSMQQQLQMAMMAQIGMFAQMGMTMGASPIPPPPPPFEHRALPSFAGSWDSNVTDMASSLKAIINTRAHAQEQISNTVSRTESWAAYGESSRPYSH